MTRVEACLESHLVNTKLHLDPNGRCTAHVVNGRRGTSISYYHRIVESGYAFKKIGLIDDVISFALLIPPYNAISANLHSSLFRGVKKLSESRRSRRPSNTNAKQCLTCDIRGQKAKIVKVKYSKFQLTPSTIPKDLKTKHLEPTIPWLSLEIVRPIGKH